jgi:hypothetical protein
MTNRPARSARRAGHRFSAGVAALAGAVFLGFGLWAFLAPHSFATLVVALPPYHRHLTHDVGAFQIGIGAALWAALAVRDALTVALVGASAGTTVHLASHIVDHGLGGGHDADVWLLGLLAVAVVAATVVRLRLARPGR